MSDRIVVMNAGVVEQVGEPFEIYNRPATRFVASFVGTLNLLDAIVRDPAGGVVAVDGQEIDLKRPLMALADSNVSLALRPEAISLGRRPDSDAAFRGQVAAVNFLGSVVRVKVVLETHTLSLDVFNTAAATLPKPGDIVEVGFSTVDVLLTAR